MGTILTLKISLILAEILYSKHKKDDVFSFSGAIGNILRGVVSIFLNKKLYFFYIFVILFFSSFVSINTSAYNFNFPIFLLCLFSFDFLGYLTHMAHHKISALFAFHTVHHSDKKVNLTTYYRTSWVEQIYHPPFFMLTFLILGFNLYDILIVTSIITTYSFLCHNHYINLPKFFDYIFITPENHRVHHDENIKNQNSNYGNHFSIWDRMFGTFVRSRENIIFGIKNYHQDNFIRMETEPIINYFRKK